MLVDLLGAALGATDATALVSDERTWTYGDLDRVVTEKAERLRASGVRAGRVLPVTLDATADGIIRLLALWRAGVTPAPLNSRLTQAERDAIVAALSDEACSTQAVLWTSGTAGRPRGVAISYGGLVASARAAQARLDLGVEDVWLASLSPAHVGGLALITRALLLGSRLVAVGAFDADRTAALIAGRDLPAGRDRPVTHASLVPTQLLRLLDVWGSGPPPSSFRCALVGGARAPAALVGAALDAGWPVALTYGLSEATSQVATAPPALTKRKPGTVGPVLDGVDVTFADDGEILVRGATLSPAYVGSGSGPVADADGWHHTGDLGHMDDEGHLWVTGRRSDRIVTGGVTVDAIEVEEVLRSHASVLDACVVGLPDLEWGERVAAWVVPADDSLDLEALDAFLRDRLSGAKRPRAFHVADVLPRNANGKVDRGAVREGAARSQS